MALENSERFVKLPRITRTASTADIEFEYIAFEIYNL